MPAAEFVLSVIVERVVPAAATPVVAVVNVPLAWVNE
jgi:hypothetical protein